MPQQVAQHLDDTTIQAKGVSKLSQCLLRHCTQPVIVMQPKAALTSNIFPGKGSITYGRKYGPERSLTLVALKLAGAKAHHAVPQASKHLANIELLQCQSAMAHSADHCENIHWLPHLLDTVAAAAAAIVAAVAVVLTAHSWCLCSLHAFGQQQHAGLQCTPVTVVQLWLLALRAKQHCTHCFAGSAVAHKGIALNQNTACSAEYPSPAVLMHLQLHAPS